MTLRELETLLTTWLIDIGIWVVEILVLIAIASVGLYLVVGIPLIVLLDRRLQSRL